MPIGATLFDCDGVLVDSEALSGSLLTQMLLEEGVDTQLDVLASVSGIQLSALLSSLNSQLPVALPRDFETRFRVREYALLAAQVEPIPGLFQALERLHLPRAVASNGPMEKLRTTLYATGLQDHFAPHIYSAYDLGMFKPAPDLYLYAAGKLGIAASECVVIEDSLAGARAGLAAGMRVIGYGPDSGELARLGAHPLERMSELPDLLSRLD